jgi:polyisoprenoid-binding protein YceI
LHPETLTATGSPRRRLLLLAAGGAALAVAAAAFGVWLVWFSSAAPAPASLDDAVAAVGSASPGASSGPDATAAATAAPTAGSTGSASQPADGVDGTWTVDTSIGSFADYTSSFAGFRVDEVLSSIGSTTAIGRTPDVSGELTIADGTLTAGTIEVDLTSIRSDQSRRDPAIQRALETGAFPTASFTLTAPVALPDGAETGDQVTVTAAGDLTILGVTQPVQLTLEASLVDDVIVAVGSIDLTFTDFGVQMPTAPIVVSVEDHGQIEFQLFFSRD